MQPNTENSGMARRALLTDWEREEIAGEGDNEYVAVSRVRKKISEELEDDVDHLREHNPGLLEELREVVCPDEESAVVAGPEPTATETPEEPEIDTPTPTPDVVDGRLPAEIDSAVWAAVDRVAESWDDDGRLDNRRSAAAHVLQYAVSSGDVVGKSHDVVDEARRELPVEGQSRETYWRQNIRSVLSEVGDYSRGKSGYSVDGVDPKNDG